MAGKRTRKEKLVAQLRRKLRAMPEPQIETKRIVTTGNFYNPEIILPTNALRSDLTRTAVMTILALILQMAVYIYLNSGGWQTVLRLLEKIVERG